MAVYAYLCRQPPPIAIDDIIYAIDAMRDTMMKRNIADDGEMPLMMPCHAELTLRRLEMFY